MLTYFVCLFSVFQVNVDSSVELDNSPFDYGGTPVKSAMAKESQTPHVVLELKGIITVGGKTTAFLSNPENKRSFFVRVGESLSVKNANYSTLNLRVKAIREHEVDFVIEDREHDILTIR